MRLVNTRRRRQRRDLKSKIHIWKREFSLIYFIVNLLIINSRKIYDAWKYVFIAAHVTQDIIDAET